MKYATIHNDVQAGSNCYAVTIDGDSLVPEYRNGDVVICDPDQEPVIGDIVMVWWKGGKGVADMVRLVTAPPPRDMWNDCESFEPILICERLNPPRKLRTSLSHVESVHKVVTRAA